MWARVFDFILYIQKYVVTLQTERLLVHRSSTCIVEGLCRYTMGFFFVLFFRLSLFSFAQRYDFKG